MKEVPWPYCAKGGHEWRHRDSNFVCPKHEGPGLYTHCGVCGKPMPTVSRRYVHDECRKKDRPVVIVNDPPVIVGEAGPSEVEAHPAES